MGKPPLRSKPLKPLPPRYVSPQDWGRQSPGSGYGRSEHAPSCPDHGGPDDQSTPVRSAPVKRASYHSPFRLMRTLSNALLGTALILAALTGFGVWRSGERFFEGARTMLTPAPAEPEVDVRSVVVQQLRGASELTTAIFAMEAVVPTRSDRTLAGYVIGSTNLLYIAYGEVRAGVDLAQITAADIQLSDSAIAITLPPPQILDSKLDLTRSDVYDYDRGFLGFGPDNAPELQELAQREALSKIEAAACQEGLLAEANRRAEMAVSQLLSTAGFATVTVTTQPALDSLCANPANSDTVN
jgi:hypothetical protein